jgi:hypothetical protein
VKPILVAVALALAAAALGPPSGPPALADLAVTREGENFRASARLVDGLDPQILDEIEAGIETTLRYRLQVFRRRDGWPDDAIARHVVECTVHRDALSRQYTLTRRVDDELAERRVTMDAAEMRAFLTTLPAVVVARAPDLPADAPVYLRARCELGLVWRFYLIPWRVNTDWARVDLVAPEAGHADAP